MLVKLYDTKTRETVVNKDLNYSLYWWSEGNGGCDCNRSIAFDLHDELEDKYGVGRCFGENRFIVIDVCLTDKIKRGISTPIIDIIKLLNENYPEELQKLAIEIYSNNLRGEIK